MTKLDELAFLDATDQADLIRRKKIKPVELVQVAIERIERLNPTLNAVITPMYEHALAEAKGNLPDGPFAGVPFLLKDLLAAYAGVPMTLGSELMRHFVPDHDSELVIRLKHAGLIILGKTNAPEFGILPTTEPRLFGPCRNPWGTNRTTGGSSGGSAAAVAAGMVAMAHGNDGGGSIRIPASCCGLFGLKPTRARNPLGPDFGDIMSGLVVEHAITRSVRDSAALLDATSGPDRGDPYWAPPPSRPFLEEVEAAHGKLRVAFVLEGGPGIKIHEDCVKALEDAATLCHDLGHDVVMDTPNVEREFLTQAFMDIWAAGCATNLEGISRVTGRPPNPDKVEPLTWALYEMGRKVKASDYLLSLNTIQNFGRSMDRFLEKYDVFMTPTLAEPPVPLGTFDSPKDNPLQGLVRALAFVPFTPIANTTGQPAMSVPLYWNDEDLPVGIHFIGRFGDEATLFRLAAQLEQARPWADRRPPVSA
ncbi:MAG: amidase [Desulfobacteraceae bacterium]|jgi:amidase